MRRLALALSLLGAACGGDDDGPANDPDARTDPTRDGGEPDDDARTRRDGGPGSTPCTASGAEVCDGDDDDCDGEIDEGYVLSCRPCPDGDDPACVEATVAAGAWRTGIARNLRVGNDRGIALPPLPRRNDFLYVSNSNDDTVSKIRVSDGAEMGRFLVGPNPSRTAVDGNGDAWVAMRGTIGTRPDGTLEGIVKIDGACTPLVAPPTPTRECISIDLRNVGDLLRGVAIDARGDVWIASFHQMEIVRLDGASGVERQRIVLDPPTNPYGLAVDENGYVWVAGAEGASVLRVDPVLGEVDLALTTGETDGLRPYGLAVDGEGGVWFGSNDRYVFRVDSTTGAYGPRHDVGGTTRGVSIDDDGHLWAADSGGDTAIRIDRETGEILAQPTVGVGPVGVSVDHDGNVWAANYFSHDVTKLSPEGAVLGTFAVGNYPYTYSDMTGSAFRVFRRMRGTFVGTFASGIDGARWTGVRWDGDVPAPAVLSMRVRAADREPELATADWSEVDFDGRSGSLDVVGAHLEIEVALSTEARTAVPFLERLIFQLER